jgi:UDP-N-acetylmuramoylalanine--D-glutamate ligase
MNERSASSQDMTNLHTLVVGLAREGTALARFLAVHGAKVTVTDIKPAEALTDGVDALSGLPVSLALGGHPVALLDSADMVFVSPGVPLEIPFLVEARRRGLPLSSETRLFTRLCPAPVVGITGSSGKTTTTAMVGDMLKCAGWRTWVGGNIGRPLIGLVDEISTTDLVVMELSSFQLEFFAPWPQGGQGRGATHLNSVLLDPAGWSPPIAAVLNITPNHLDRHATIESYTAAKMHILNYQRPGDIAVLNFDNPVTRRIGEEAASRGQRVLWFSLEQSVEEGAFLQGEELILRLAGREEVLCGVKDLKLLGRHNLANSLAAGVLAASVSLIRQSQVESMALLIEALRQTLASFPGLDHRLELVRDRGGVRWYNDSIATTPERTVAALRAFDAPIVLLAGGRDKHLPWDKMAALTWRKVRHLILFGEAASLIERAMYEVQHSAPTTPYGTQISHAGTLQQAVELAARLAQPGDVVLLSPGGTSFDAYRDFVARGDHFRQLVRALE